ncbi:hypothetical protein TNCV_4116531 [Trichonephila clavipes]|nr:hypothetical protein TNCV_4116531 [Trichonephila clavipes]
MNSPVQLAEKLEEFEDFKRTLKQKSSSLFVEKQDTNSQRRIADIKHRENLSITEKIRSFQRQRITTNTTKPLSPYESHSKDIKTTRRKGITTKLQETLKSQCFQAYAQTNYSKSQKFKEPPKETCTLIVKEGLRTKEIFFGKVKITALIDSGSTV